MFFKHTYLFLKYSVTQLLQAHKFAYTHVLIVISHEKPQLVSKNSSVF